ncbi:MAG TPA: hypothetical protein VEF03_05655, partial [Candidatus Binataceae bacterium]|nr:hypothetical protein [Candidatus Binataceae bacterium]
QKAFDAASKLPEREQEEFGRWVLEELAAERRWDKAFSRSRDRLANLAEVTLAEHRKGRSKPLDPQAI